MNNAGRGGFEGFRQIIDEIAEDLGGRHTRDAVAHEFETALGKSLRVRINPKSYVDPSWTCANEIDFEAATAYAARFFHKRHQEQPLLGRASWNNAEIVLRRDQEVGSGATAYLVGERYVAVLLLTSRRSQYDTRARGQVEKWSPFLTDTAKRILNANASTSLYGLEYPRMDNTTNASEASAIASARKLIDGFFAVTLSKESKA